MRLTLTVSAPPQQVRILDGAEVIATHPRSYGKAQQIEDPAHLEALIKIKRKAWRHRGQDRLIHGVPKSQELLNQAAGRGDHLGSITAAFLCLLDDYSSQGWRVVVNEKSGTRCSTSQWCAPGARDTVRSINRHRL